MLHRLSEYLISLAPVRLQQTVRQFIKFGMTGAIGAIVDFSTFNILTRIIGWDTIYTVLGFEIIAANLVSVFMAIVSNFYLNKYWTFRNDSREVVKQGAGYFALNFVTFILNQIFTSVFAFRVPAIAQIFGSQKDNVAKALAIGLILFVNFAGSKFLIFRKPTAKTTRSNA